MKEKILALLKAKATGVANEVLTGVAVWLATTVTKEEDIATAVDGVLPLLTTMQSENDRRVTTFQTENTTLKTEIAALKGKTPPKKEDDPKDPDVPAWAQAIIDQNQALLGQVEALKSENIGKLHQNALVAKLKELEVPEKFFAAAIKGRTFKDETEITAFADEIKTSYSEYAQDLADQGLGATHKPILPLNPDKSKAPAAVETYIKERFEPANAGTGLGGKKL